MKKTLFKTSVSIFFALACSFSVWAETQILDNVIAIVDSDIISKSGLDARVQQIQTSAKKQQSRLPPADMLRQQVLDRLIVESIQMQMGERAGVRISDAALTETMENIADNNGMTLTEFKRTLEADGMSYSDTREQIRREMIINQVQQGNLNHRIQVTDQEVENYLASVDGKELSGGQYHLAHILFSLPSSASEKQANHLQDTAQELSRQLNAGKIDFTSVSENGQFAGIELQTSDLGWRKSKDIPSIFTGYAPRLKPGEVSTPIRSASGFHLIQLIDKRGGSGQIVEQTHARHILIKPSKIRSESQAQELAAELRSRALEGEEFAELAKLYSEDPGSTLQGGDLGWSSPGQFVPIFEQTMATLKENEISEPFKSQFGWHILQVLERRQHDVSMMRWQNIARNKIHQRKFNEELQSWLVKIRDEAFVEFK